MTEFTFAPGEKNIIGDRFSPSVIIFWLKTSIAASSTRILRLELLEQHRRVVADARVRERGELVRIGGVRARHARG